MGLLILMSAGLLPALLPCIMFILWVSVSHHCWHHILCVPFHAGFPTIALSCLWWSLTSYWALQSSAGLLPLSGCFSKNSSCFVFRCYSTACFLAISIVDIKLEFKKVGFWGDMHLLLPGTWAQRNCTFTPQPSFRDTGVWLQMHKTWFVTPNSLQ